jgi:hypothetical protein
VTPSTVSAVVVIVWMVKFSLPSFSHQATVLSSLDAVTGAIQTKDKQLLILLDFRRGIA